MNWAETIGESKCAVGSSDAELLQLYYKETESMRRTWVRRGSLLASLAYLLFSIVDVLLLPDVAGQVILLRFISCGLMLGSVEWMWRHDSSLIRIEAVCAIGIVLCYLAWLVPALQSQNHDALSYYMIYAALFMMSANLFFEFRLSLSLLTSTLILVAFLIALNFVDAGAAYRLAIAVFCTICVIFTGFIGWRINAERLKVFVNGREARLRHLESIERSRELLRLSRTDPLTGLDNRRAVDDQLAQSWASWREEGRNFAVLLIDVDFFKRYNDHFGHQTGDSCLIEIGAALGLLVDGEDAVIGRYGGEEFIVLAPAADDKCALALAERIRSTVEKLAISHDNRRDGVPIVTVSVGVAVTRNQPGAKLARIIQEADRALYLAKAAGRNSVHLFDPSDPQSSDESENIAALLRIAIDEKLVSLVYQPIESATTGLVVAVEALMRLTMFDGTAVPPSLFIPVAERTGAIRELGYWAIETVCRDILSPGKAQIASVNVSPVQLQTPDFAERVAEILKRAGLDGSRLALEITEGLDMEMHSNVLKCISELKRLNVNIWLDDFGTGFAGLSWLRLIDFDIVKIDRSFVHDGETGRGGAMLKDIVSLIRHRGPKIIAEGVETEAHIARVRDLGVDFVQGYYLGRARAAETFSRMPEPVDCMC